MHPVCPVLHVTYPLQYASVVCAVSTGLRCRYWAACEPVDAASHSQLSSNVHQRQQQVVSAADLVVVVVVVVVSATQ